LLGAHLAGAAIENSMLGATHSLANPLSAHFDLVHGVAIGILLPHVIRYNAGDPATARMYAELARSAGFDGDAAGAEDVAAAEWLANRIRELVQQAGQPEWLVDCDVDEALLPRMAAEAAE